MAWDDTTARGALEQLFQAAIQAADPRTILKAHLPELPRGKIIVVGAGKSAAVMASAVEEAWPAVPLTGLVVTRYGHKVPTSRIEVVEASHPVPDQAGADAAARILQLVKGLTADDLVLALISGGGSSLLALPAPGLSLQDKQDVNRSLLACGATIHEMNCVRRHLSAIKGGRLAAAAYPARTVTLAISDVPGDDATVIASGPTVADPTTFAEARAIVSRYGITVPEKVRLHLERGVDETPKPGEEVIGAAEFRLIATPQMALEAAAQEARRLGLTPLLLGDALEGEAAILGTVLSGMARSARIHGHPVHGPAVLLSGGETTVTIRPDTPRGGRGGRNTECLLSFALAMQGMKGVWALMGDTDGIDGSEDNAGAIAMPDTLKRAHQLGLDPRQLMTSHNSHALFHRLGDTIVTGPTLTNVNDFRVILIA
ncbi:glycerate kinase [Pseudoroseomonas globiformis]|uniref:Glycerate kinase n=1 Tax=Teichococcus globiformis TaxID=2307229 RepID=A0ABV7G3X5_9PROT